LNMSMKGFGMPWRSIALPYCRFIWTTKRIFAVSLL
jgi:hypothetical protein